VIARFRSPRLVKWTLAALLGAALGVVDRADASDPDAAARAFGARLARAFNERDLAELERLIDLPAPGLRAARPVLDNAASRKEFAKRQESSA